MTARRAEPNGGPRVVTMGKYRSWAPRDTARWSLRVITMAPRSQPETGSNQAVRVAGTSTEVFQNQENISHLKQETRKCTESRFCGLPPSHSSSLPFPHFHQRKVFKHRTNGF